MRKKELISTHALLVEVAQYLIETEDMPPGLMSTYYDLGVTPLGVHRSKADHYEAITVLFGTITLWFDRERTAPVHP